MAAPCRVWYSFLSVSSSLASFLFLGGLTFLVSAALSCSTYESIGLVYPCPQANTQDCAARIDLFLCLLLSPRNVNLQEQRDIVIVASGARGLGSAKPVLDWPPVQAHAGIKKVLTHPMVRLRITFTRPSRGGIESYVLLVPLVLLLPLLLFLLLQALFFMLSYLSALNGVRGHTLLITRWLLSCIESIPSCLERSIHSDAASVLLPLPVIVYTLARIIPRCSIPLTHTLR